MKTITFAQRTILVDYVYALHAERSLAIAIKVALAEIDARRNAMARAKQLAKRRRTGSITSAWPHRAAKKAARDHEGRAHRYRRLRAAAKVRRRTRKGHQG